MTYVADCPWSRGRGLPGRRIVGSAGRVVDPSDGRPPYGCRVDTYRVSGNRMLLARLGLLGFAAVGLMLSAGGQGWSAGCLSPAGASACAGLPAAPFVTAVQARQATI